MKPLFPTYIIKKHARAVMRGKLFKSFFVAIIPTAVVLLVAAAMYFFVPGAKQSFELALNGSFASIDERQAYLEIVMQNFTWAIDLLLVLFAFLSTGASKLFLDMVRGKEFKIRDIFCFYNKWYIASIYPLLTLAVSFGANKALQYLTSLAGEQVASVFALIFNIITLVVGFKLMFIDYCLAENGCSDFIGAVKASWKMVGFNTAANSVILAFSFIGWMLASTFTCGILLIYVLPYLSLSLATLYDANKKYETENIN